MELLTALLTIVAAAMGFIALGLGVFVCDAPPCRQRPQGSREGQRTNAGCREHCKSV